MCWFKKKSLKCPHKTKTTTKSDLKQRSLDLLREKDFETISVSDIAKEAGVNRGTFYLHYVDKFDMMDKLIDEILQNILSLLKEGQPKNKQEAFPGIVKIFEYLKRLRFCSRDDLWIGFNYTAKLVHDFLLELTRQIGPIKEKYRDGLSAARRLRRKKCLSIAIARFSSIGFKRRRGNPWRNRKNLLRMTV